MSEANGVNLTVVLCGRKVNMKTDLTWVYLMLYITMMSSCTGPTSGDIRRIADEVQAVKAECAK